jgi:hypothetical protein
MRIISKEDDATHDGVDDDERRALEVVTLPVLEDVVHENRGEEGGKGVHVWKDECEVVLHVVLLEKHLRDEHQDGHLQQANLQSEVATA